MTRPRVVAWLSTLMECLLPRDLGELAVGDLNEEFALRLASGSGRRAVRWFVVQAVASLPRLLALSVRRLSWLRSLGVAVAAYMLLGLVEPQAHRLLALVIEPRFELGLVMDLGVGFFACACGGFLSTWLHRGSAVIYSVIGTAFLVSAMMRGVNPDLPFWFLAAFVAVAFVAPIVGGAAFVAAVRTAGRNRRQGGNCA